MVGVHEADCFSMEHQAGIGPAVDTVADNGDADALRMCGVHT